MDGIGDCVQEEGAGDKPRPLPSQQAALTVAFFGEVDLELATVDA